MGDAILLINYSLSLREYHKQTCRPRTLSKVFDHLVEVVVTLMYGPFAEVETYLVSGLNETTQK
jgi:hypothetical protein